MYVAIKRDVKKEDEVSAGQLNTFYFKQKQYFSTSDNLITKNLACTCILHVPIHAEHIPNNIRINMSILKTVRRKGKHYYEQTLSKPFDSYIN